MGLLDVFRRKPKNENKSFTPPTVVVGGSRRKSMYEVGDIDKIVADGVQLTPRVIRYLRYLAVTDEDIFGAVRDLVVLANPGFRLSFVAPSQRDEARARSLLENIDSLFESGSAASFMNNQISEVVTTGASSVEWVPNKERNGIRRAFTVPAETVGIERVQGGRLRYYQEWGGERIYLNPTTYSYIPLQTVGDSPYGVPLVVAALSALDRKGKMLEGIDRLIYLLGIAGIVHAKVHIPPPDQLGYESELDPAYLDQVTSKLRKVADLLSEGEREGVIVTPEGTEVDIVSPARDISGAYPAWLDNEHRVWSGSRTLPFMRGRSESLSETWAKVAYPIILAEAKNIQSVVKRQMEFGLNLHLRLAGIPAKVALEFKEPQSPFIESNARARRTEAEADKILLEILGEDPELIRMIREKNGLSPEPKGGEDGG